MWSDRSDNMNLENFDVSTASLYVGNLHHSVTEATLFEKFSALGPISFIHVCRHQSTQLPLGFGYVTFALTEHAERAIDEMNFDMVKGEMIRLLWTKSVPSLPKTCVEDTIRTLKKHAHKRDIFEMFTLFKNIISSSGGENENYCTKKIILPGSLLNNDAKDDFSDAKNYELDVPSVNVTTSSFNPDSHCVLNETGNPIHLDEVRRNLVRWKDSSDVKSIGPVLNSNDFTHNRCNATSNLMLNEDEGHLEDEGYQTIDENLLSYESNESTEPYSLNTAPVHIVNSDSTPARLASKQVTNMSTSDFIKTVNNDNENKKVTRIRYVPQRLREINSENERLFKNVYVKNFGDEMNNEDLFDLFNEFGPILNCEVMRSSDGLSRGFGFVKFERPPDAKKAVSALNGKMLRNGKQIYVSRAQKKAERLTQLKKSFEDRKPVCQYQGTNLYVKNLDDSMDDSQLYDIFSQFGNITSAKVMKEQEHSKGFGFVCFSAPSEATKAVTEMNGTIVGSKPLYVALAQRKEDRQAHLASQCIQLLTNLKKQEKEPKGEDSDLEPVTFEDILLSEPPQVIPEFDDLLPIGPPSVLSNITDSLSNSLNGGSRSRVPYQLEHLPNPVPFPFSGLPKRKIGHYQISGGPSRGSSRSSANATSPPRNVSPQRWSPAVMTVPGMQRCNEAVGPGGYEPRVECTDLYTYHENYPSFKQCGFGRGMIPHSYQTNVKRGIR